MPLGHIVSTQGGNDDNDLGGDHVNMSTIRDNIADVLFASRGGDL